MSLACQKRFLLVLGLIYIAMPLVSSQECERSEFSKQYDVTCGSVRYRRDYCTPGQMVNDPCSDDSVCEYCPAGQYQDMYTNCRTCLPCTRKVDCCNDQVLVKQCLSDKNSVCGCPPCPVVTCPTLPVVTCPPVPNVTCPPVTPCPPCPTEPDITTTPENTCPPCPTAEENNPTSPSDGKSNTCPPVEPSLSPGTLVSNSEGVHIIWQFWGIIAIILLLAHWVTYLLLYCRRANCLKKLCPHTHQRLDQEIENHQPPLNQGNPPDPENPVQPVVPAVNGGQPGAGGDNKHVKGGDAPDNGQSPQKINNLYVSMAQKGHDDGDEASRPLIQEGTNPAGAEGGIPQDGDTSLQNMSVNFQNEPTLEFVKPELGEEKMQDIELHDITDDLFHNYWGHAVETFESLFTLLGMVKRDYAKHLMDRKHDGDHAKIFYVLCQWQEQCSCDRNYYRKHLSKICPKLSNRFVQRINATAEDSSDM